MWCGRLVSVVQRDVLRAVSIDRATQCGASSQYLWNAILCAVSLCDAWCEPLVPVVMRSGSSSCSKLMHCEENCWHCDAKRCWLRCVCCLKPEKDIWIVWKHVHLSIDLFVCCWKVENSKGEAGIGQHELNIKFSDILRMVKSNCFEEKISKSSPILQKF